MVKISLCPKNNDVENTHKIPPVTESTPWIYLPCIITIDGQKLTQKLNLVFYIPFNSQGHIGTGNQHCHLWETYRGGSL